MMILRESKEVLKESGCTYGCRLNIRLFVAQRNLKLSPRFYGPFQVERNVGTIAYRLSLSTGSPIHPVFHVSQLKLKLGKNNPSNRTSTYSGWSRSHLTRTRRNIKQKLKKDPQLSSSGASWEPFHTLKNTYPHLMGNHSSNPSIISKSLLLWVLRGNYHPRTSSKQPLVFFFFCFLCIFLK